MSLGGVALLTGQLLGCGGSVSDQTSNRTLPENSSQAAPLGREPSVQRQTAENPKRSPAKSDRAWKLAARPVVVAFLTANPPPYTVYFKLTRKLPPGANAVIVTLEGVGDYNVSGTGYDHFTPGNCYTWGLDYGGSGGNIPASLRRPNAARALRVKLRFLQSGKNVIVRSVTPQSAVPEEVFGEVGSASAVRLRRLGCAE